VSEAILELAGVTVAYRDRLAIHDIDLIIAAGERVALIGPNGAGKSTLLSVSTGAIEPASGVIHLAGRRLDTMSRDDIARRVAVVPGSVSLPFAMRVEEVVALGRLPYEDPFRGLRPADRVAILGAIERVGIGHLLGRDARELSLGERQLVLIALALAQGTEILILDEPTVHLDLRHQVEAMELLTDLNERDGTTVIAVLHDLALAAHFFPRVVVMDHGRIVVDGPPSESLDAERISEVFGVDPALVRLPVGRA
jgi:iron complex transport system ATP-binding protein